MIISEVFIHNKLKIDSASICDKGKRIVNEDTADIGKTGKIFYAFVADGLGGHGGGEIASSVCAKTVVECLGKPVRYCRSKIREIFRKADKNIIAKQDDKVKMKTTLALVMMSCGRLYVSHIGDTRIYIIKDGYFSHMSKDHTEAFERAMLSGGTLDDIRNDPQRHILSAALGSGKPQSFELYREKVSENMSILICSDGFWEYVNEDDMLKTLESSQSSSAWLCKMIKIHNEKASRFCDNYSAICLRTERHKGG